MPVVGFLLRRIGSQFVVSDFPGGRQRDATASDEDAGRALAGVFPEGHVDDKSD
jgi:hypothetical protein